MEIVKERMGIRERVIEEAADWARKLPFTATAVLVGSYARGDFNLWTDVDVILVSDTFKGSPLDRLRMLDTPPAYQVVPLTPEEFKRLVEKGDQLAIEALTIGVILREDVKIPRLSTKGGTRNPI